MVSYGSIAVAAEHRVQSVPKTIQGKLGAFQTKPEMAGQGGQGQTEARAYTNGRHDAVHLFLEFA